LAGVQGLKLEEELWLCWMLAACMFPMAVLLQSQLLGFGSAGAFYLMLIQLGEATAASSWQGMHSTLHVVMISSWSGPVAMQASNATCPYLLLNADKHTTSLSRQSVHCLCCCNAAIVCALW
jgi:hypothetical protein